MYLFLFLCHYFAYIVRKFDGVFNWQAFYQQRLVVQEAGVQFEFILVVVKSIPGRRNSLHL